MSHVKMLHVVCHLKQATLEPALAGRVERGTWPCPWLPESPSSMYMAA